MYSNIKNSWFLFIVLFIIIFIWVGINQEDEKPHSQYSLPEIKLSSLPDDLEESLAKIKERADSKQKEFEYKFSGFNFMQRFDKNVITGETPLILKTHYQGDEKTVQNVTSMPKSFMGMTISQIKDILQDWQVVEYRPDQALILTREKRGFSPETQKKRYLGIEDDRVAIYNEVEGSRKIQQLTDIRVEDLPESEQEALREGIEIESEEELLTILEGLISINED